MAQAGYPLFFGRGGQPRHRLRAPTNTAPGTTTSCATNLRCRDAALGAG